MAASLMTVVREMPSSSAMAVFGTPSAASRLMYAQSSNVITLPCSGVHFSAANLFSFRAASTQCRTACHSFRSLAFREDEKALLRLIYELAQTANWFTPQPGYFLMPARLSSPSPTTVQWNDFGTHEAIEPPVW